MKKARKKLNKAARNSAKRPKPRSKIKFITRAEARRRAERHVLNRMFKGATVRDGAEAKLCIYIRGDWSVKDTWVVYKNPKENRAQVGGRDFGLQAHGPGALRRLGGRRGMKL